MLDHRHFQNYLKYYFLKPDTIHKDRRDFHEQAQVTHRQHIKDPKRSIFVFRDEADTFHIIGKAAHAASPHAVDFPALLKLTRNVLGSRNEHQPFITEAPVNNDEVVLDEHDSVSFAELMGIDDEDPLDAIIREGRPSPSFLEEAQRLGTDREVQNMGKQEKKKHFGVSEYEEYLEGFSIGEFGEKLEFLDESEVKGKRKQNDDPETLKKKRLAASRDYHRVMDLVGKGGLQSFK